LSVAFLINPLMGTCCCEKQREIRTQIRRKKSEERRGRALVT
jgi:hypothetical protein